MNAPRPARWPILVALGLLLAATGTLLWLRGRLLAEEDSAVAGTVRLFEKVDVLGRPENRQVRFRDIEALVSAVEAGDLVIELRATKNVANLGEVTVVPFAADLSQPGWREAVPWHRLPVGAGPDGWLYFRLDARGRVAVDAVILAFSALFLIGLGALLLRQRDRETLLSRTVVELEERRAEVIRLERLALAGQLSANIFHDLKKPVLNIKHEVDDARETGPSPELLSTLSQQTELFLRMMRELGFEDFVRGGRDVAEWCDVRDAVDRALRLVRYERRDVRVEVTAEEGVPLVMAVPHRLVQVFSNLALNAFQAMQGKGELRISIGAQGPRCIVQVRDSGPGIPAEIRDSLFSPFATTRAEQGGSGLGLYICRKIVTDLGGTITLEPPVPGTGAAFRVEFPAETGSLAAR